jgi:WXG100 family type VII secretion target
VEQLTVDFATLADAESAADRTVTELEEHLARLRTDVARLTESWTGPAADAYQRYQQEWDRAADDLKGALAQLHRIMRIAHGNYAAALRANTSMWRAR